MFNSFKVHQYFNFKTMLHHQSYFLLGQNVHENRDLNCTRSASSKIKLTEGTSKTILAEDVLGNITKLQL